MKIKKSSKTLFKNTLKDYIKKRDSIRGGLSDKLSLSDIAKKHNVSMKLIVTQLRLGIQVEFEHTNDIKTATEIAMDHLVEDPKYYSKLQKIEH